MPPGRGGWGGVRNAMLCGKWGVGAPGEVSCLLAQALRWRQRESASMHALWLWRGLLSFGHV